MFRFGIAIPYKNRVLYTHTTLARNVNNHQPFLLQLSPHGSRHSGQNCAERIGGKFRGGRGGCVFAGEHGTTVASVTVATSSPQDESVPCADQWPVCVSTVTRERRPTGPWLQR